ncbi:MAG: gamma-glutamyltransferase family protein [Pseudomonadota bacterium]
MLHSVNAYQGMTTAPHHLAAQAGCDVLKDGGNAVEAAVAIAATLAVVYPHMTGIGGDGFWLIAEPDGRISSIDACGRSSASLSMEPYADLAAIPPRGPLAANTVAGTVAGWQTALDGADGSLPLSRLLRDAIHYAREGVVVTKGGAGIAKTKGDELRVQPGAYCAIFEPEGRPLAEGDLLKQPLLAEALEVIADQGTDCFYKGELAASIAEDLATLGCPVTADDLAAHQVTSPTPLTVSLGDIDLFNMTPPTQGVASLLILALFDRLKVTEGESFEHIHGLVEATKQAFLYRDAHVGDPAWMNSDPQALLDDADGLDAMAGRIDMETALPWPQPPSAGDTTWFGAADRDGRVVSVIQSTYFEFGSGVVLPKTGITWQNRGSSFRLAEDGWNALKPSRKPFHTLNPAMARFADGRTMAYGTMGGEGQPQTQAALFTRYTRFGMGLQEAITAPRWLLGRTWGEESTSLKLENRFTPALIEALKKAGHAVEMMDAFTATMGHAGAIVRHADGRFEGATDPRSDGMVAAW